MPEEEDSQVDVEDDDVIIRRVIVTPRSSWKSSWCMSSPPSTTTLLRYRVLKITQKSHFYNDISANRFYWCIRNIMFGFTFQMRQFGWIFKQRGLPASLWRQRLIHFGKYCLCKHKFEEHRSAELLNFSNRGEEAEKKNPLRAFLKGFVMRQMGRVTDFQWAMQEMRGWMNLRNI